MRAYARRKPFFRERSRKVGKGGISQHKAGLCRDSWAETGDGDGPRRAPRSPSASASHPRRRPLPATLPGRIGQPSRAPSAHRPAFPNGQPGQGERPAPAHRFPGQRPGPCRRGDVRPIDSRTHPRRRRAAPPCRPSPSMRPALSPPLPPSLPGGIGPARGKGRARERATESGRHRKARNAPGQPVRPSASVPHRPALPHSADGERPARPHPLRRPLPATLPPARPPTVPRPSIPPTAPPSASPPPAPPPTVPPASLPRPSRVPPAIPPASLPRAVSASRRRAASVPATVPAASLPPSLPPSPPTVPDASRPLPIGQRRPLPARVPSAPIDSPATFRPCLAASRRPCGALGVRAGPCILPAGTAPDGAREGQGRGTGRARRGTAPAVSLPHPSKCRTPAPSIFPGAIAIPTAPRLPFLAFSPER